MADQGKHIPDAVGRWITFAVPGRYRNSPPEIYQGVVINEMIIIGKRYLLAQGEESQFVAPFDQVVFARECDYGREMRKPLSPATIEALRERLASGQVPVRKVKKTRRIP